MNTSILVKSIEYISNNYRFIVSLSTWINSLLEISEAAKATKEKIIKILKSKDFNIINIVIPHSTQTDAFDEHILETYQLEDKKYQLSKSEYVIQNEITKLLINNGATIHESSYHFLKHMIDANQDDMVLFLLKNFSSLYNTDVRKIINKCNPILINKMIKNYKLDEQELIIKEAIGNKLTSTVELVLIKYRDEVLEFIFSQESNFYDLGMLTEKIIAKKVVIETTHAQKLLNNSFRNNDYTSAESLLKYQINAHITEHDFKFLKLVLGFDYTNKPCIKEINDTSNIELVLDTFYDKNDIKTVHLVKYGRLDLIKTITNESCHEMAFKAIKYGHLDIFVEYKDCNKLEEYLTEAEFYNQKHIIDYIMKLKSNELSTD